MNIYFIKGFIIHEGGAWQKYLIHEEKFSYEQFYSHLEKCFENVKIKYPQEYFLWDLPTVDKIYEEMALKFGYIIPETEVEFLIEDDTLIELDN